MKLEINIPRWSQSFELKRTKEILKGQGFFFYLGERPEKKIKAIIEQHALDYQKPALLKMKKKPFTLLAMPGQCGCNAAQKRKTLFTRARFRREFTHRRETGRVPWSEFCELYSYHV